MKTVNEIITEMNTQEEERKRTVEEGILSGCESCSRWDGYWGCKLCDSLLKGDKNGL